MKILYVFNSGKMGGMERHVLDLVSGMKNNGETVYIWCPDGEMEEMYKNAGAVFYRKKINFDIDIPYIISLKDFIKKEKIDVVHAHELKAVINTLIAGKFANTNNIITHTHTPISTWKINNVKKMIDYKIYSFLINTLSYKEIALTESVKKVKIREGIHEDKIVVIPNGIDTEKLDITDDNRKLYSKEIRERLLIPQDSIIFGCLGRLTVEKGHSIAIEAFAKLVNENVYIKDKIRLLIAGGGILENKLKELAKELKIEDKIIITGVFKEEDLKKYYSTFDVFIFPSLTEGFGLALAEAMYVNLPSVCSDLDVLEELGGEYITTFKTGSSDDLKIKMMNKYEELIHNDRDHDEDRGRKRIISKFSKEVFINNYLTLYNQLL